MILNNINVSNNQQCKKVHLDTSLVGTWSNLLRIFFRLYMTTQIHILVNVLTWCLFLKKTFEKKRIKRAKNLTLITFAPCPSCFTPHVTISCEPVTTTSTETVYVAEVHTISTIRSLLAFCNESLKHNQTIKL